jgi:hypothetical protein
MSEQKKDNKEVDLLKVAKYWKSQRDLERGLRLKEKKERLSAQQDSESTKDTFHEYTNVYAGNVKKNTYHVDKLKQEELGQVLSSHLDIQAAVNAGKKGVMFKFTKWAVILVGVVLAGILLLREDFRAWVSQNAVMFVAVIIGLAVIFVYSARQKE